MSRNKDLAAALTEKHGLAKTDAEAFVNAMFALINEALASERAVKVKGLGTFKVISVAARKSVDVNTGAPIVIDGRDKISFTPDSSLRDEVNKPFAQFETVVVNDGVDFSEIDRKFEEEETTEDTEDTGSTKDTEEMGSTKDTEDTEDIPEVTEVTEETGSTKDTEDTEVKPEVTEETTEDTEETGSTKDTEETEDIPEVTEDIPEDTEDTEDTEETGSTKNTEDTEETDNTDNTRMVEEVEEVKDEMRAVMKSEHRKMRGLMGACAAFVALCIAGAGYMFTQMQKKDNRISNLEAQVQAFTTLSKQQTAKPQPATPQSNTLQGENVATETTATAATTTPATTSAPATAKPATTTAAATTTTLSSAQAAKTTAQAGKTAQTAKGATSDAASANYAKDPRIRTGAYNIVGVDRTVTVKAGQTLSSISHFYLGQGMECYVEAVNGGRTEFKAGEKIKIPKLKHKKMR